VRVAGLPDRLCDLLRPVHRHPDHLIPDQSPLPLTPSAFLEALAARIAALNDAGTEPVRLRGIPVKTSGTARIYGGFVYAAIRDPRTTEAIDARVPEKLAASLEWGREAVLVGLVRFKSSRGEIKLEFRVDDVQEPGGARLLAKDELMARWGQAITRAKADVQAALLVDRPRLRIITGVGSVAVDDIRAQLRDAEEEVELQESVAMLEMMIARTTARTAAAARILPWKRACPMDARNPSAARVRPAPANRASARPAAAAATV
jgi:hypothetical protein